MTTPPNGSALQTPDELIYWIRERYRILTAKQEGKPAPWSTDRVFQSTYFCNVRREDDKVTKWIRSTYNPHVGHTHFELNILLARFLNWPSTLEMIGFLDTYDDPVGLSNLLKALGKKGKVWGNAYVITTHGIKMDKVDYLTNRVLPSAFSAIETHRVVLRGASCAAAASALETIEGVGSFLSGQIVADLKNTPGHPLQNAYDYTSFVVPGPGSLRGASWFHYGKPEGVTPSNFQRHFEKIREWVNDHWPSEVPRICNQDLQNCLCEFDKYMRVKTGTGRSKRGYNGS